MIERDSGPLDIKKRCELLKVSRSTWYNKPIVNLKKIENDVVLLNEIRDIYVTTPMYGYRRITIGLRERGFIVNSKKTLKLLQTAGIQAIYPKKNTSIRNLAHKVYPYLLRDMVIDRPNQVWQVDITYIKIRTGWVYLVCLIDVFSRRIMGWELSTFLDTQPCIHALSNALKYGKPDIVNSDQGCQFTSELWINTLKLHEILISMDGKRRWVDNVFVERLWRSVKYENVFLNSYDTVQAARDSLAEYIIFYNEKRYHQSLNYHTPKFVFEAKRIPSKQELFEKFAGNHANTMKGTELSKFC